MGAKQKPDEQKPHKVKVVLRFPTVGHAAGDVIEVERSEVERLVANGSVRTAEAVAKEIEADLGLDPKP